MRRLGLAAVSLLAGCTVGPNFKAPEPPRVAAYQNGRAGDAAVSLTTDPDPRWWASFNDPVLTELVQTAIRDNLDVQQAVLRVIESRQSVVTAAAAGVPQLNGTASYQYDQLGLKGILESQGVYKQLNQAADQAGQAAGASSLGGAGGAAGGPNGQTTTSILNQFTQPVNLFQYGLSASWELDLFGRCAAPSSRRARCRRRRLKPSTTR